MVLIYLQAVPNSTQRDAKPDNQLDITHRETARVR